MKSSTSRLPYPNMNLHARVVWGHACRAMAALNADKGPLFKVILLGEAGVGKTAIFHRAKENSFKDGRKNTVGIDSFSLYVKVGDQQVTVSSEWKVLAKTEIRECFFKLM